MDGEHIPLYEELQYSQMRRAVLHNSCTMSITQIISTNLNRWMSARHDIGTIEALAKAAGVGAETVRRAKNGDGNITVKKLEMIAQAFRRDPIELLADTDRAWVTQVPVTVLSVAEPPPDERELLHGYRDASDDVREIMLEAARKATSKKSFLKRSEIQ